MQNSINVSDNDTKNLTVLSRQNVLDKDFTVYGSVENPLFLAKDVAEWIDYSKTSEGFYNVSKMLMGIDDDEKTTITIRNSDGKTHNQSFVTENGLYEILMLSRKPIAKQFKKEVKKILHQIRTTGGYTVPRTFADALRLAAEQQEKIALMQPKADVYDQLVDRSKTINFRDMAEKLGMSQTEFMTILKAKYIYKNSIGEYRAYSQYQDLFSLRTYTKGVDQTGEQLLLNMKGITYFTNKYKPEAIAESFLKKGEAEYQKIIDKTADKYLNAPDKMLKADLINKALLNCPVCENTIVDKFVKTYTLKQVADMVEESEITLRRFCIAKGWMDSEGNVSNGADMGLYFHKGNLTEIGKDHIVSVYANMKLLEKGMKSSSIGKAE